MPDFKVGDKVVVTIMGEGVTGTIYTIGPAEYMQSTEEDEIAYSFIADDGVMQGIPEPIFQDDTVELLA